MRLHYGHISMNTQYTYVDMHFRYMDANNIAFPSTSYYFKVQQTVLYPVVHATWNEQRIKAIEESKAKDFTVVGGDAR